MKKKLLIFIAILFMPITVFANEHVNIICDNDSVKNTETVKCNIVASNLNYIVTSITAKVEVSDNIQIAYSSYDDKNWTIFDEKFSVKDINLISEKKIFSEEFEFASFTIKANNKENIHEKIIIKEIIFGDENYNEHSIPNNEFEINLIYDKKLDTNMVNNYSTVIGIIFICFMIVGTYQYIKIRRK